MRPTVLIFDFFGVICSEIAPFWLSERFSAREAVRIKNDVVGLADTGALSEAELFEQLSLLAGTSPETVYKEWQEYISIDVEVLGIAGASASKFRVALLSNAPSAFIRKIIADNELEPHFEEIVVSSEERVAKPAPEIFHKLLDRLKIAAGDAVMIDDNPANIAGALAVGMGGIRFTSAAQLQRAIAELQTAHSGVITNDE